MLLIQMLNLRTIVTAILVVIVTAGLFGGRVNGYFQNSNTGNVDSKPDAKIRVKALNPVSPSRETTLSFELESNGKVNVVSFTVNFDPAVFKYVSSSLGSGKPATANLGVNAEQTAAGKFGVLVDSTVPFEKGNKQIITAVFAVAKEARPGTYAFSFGSSPTQLGVATADFRMLNANHETSNIIVDSPKKAIVGRVLDRERLGIWGTTVSAKGPDGKVKSYVTGSFGYFMLDDLSDGTYTISVSGKRHSFPPQTIEPKGAYTELEFINAT